LFRGLTGVDGKQDGAVLREPSPSPIRNIVATPRISILIGVRSLPTSTLIIDWERAISAARDTMSQAYSAGYVASNVSVYQRYLQAKRSVPFGMSLSDVEVGIITIQVYERGRTIRNFLKPESQIVVRI